MGSIEDNSKGFIQMKYRGALCEIVYNRNVKDKNFKTNVPVSLLTKNIQNGAISHLSYMNV